MHVYEPLTLAWREETSWAAKWWAELACMFPKSSKLSLCTCGACRCLNVGVLACGRQDNKAENHSQTCCCHCRCFCCSQQASAYGTRWQNHQTTRPDKGTTQRNNTKTQKYSAGEFKLQKEQCKEKYSQRKSRTRKQRCLRPCEVFITSIIILKERKDWYPELSVPMFSSVGECRTSISKVS